jgi:hypothetical protein
VAKAGSAAKETDGTSTKAVISAKNRLCVLIAVPSFLLACGACAAVFGAVLFAYVAARVLQQLFVRLLA